MLLNRNPCCRLNALSTPDCSTIESLASFLGIPQEKTAKALLYVRKGTDQLVFVVVRGDMQASEREAAGGRRRVGRRQP